MMNTTILSIIPFVYLAAFISYLLMLIMGKDFYGRLGSGLAWIGLGMHSTGIILRWIESYRMGYGHAPLANLYESMVFFAWAMVAGALAAGYYRRLHAAAIAFVLPLAALCLAYASFSPDIQDHIQPLVPALKSNWLVVHVATCLMGYAALVSASVFAVLHLFQNGRQQKGTHAFVYDTSLLTLVHQSTNIGFILFTIGIMTGSVWAHYAWGSYWSWDPKETWALITWLIYAALIHIRYRASDARIIVMALLGLVSILFTYFGVNYLPGLHSYF